MRCVWSRHTTTQQAVELERNLAVEIRACLHRRGVSFTGDFGQNA